MLAVYNNTPPSCTACPPHSALITLAAVVAPPLDAALLHHAYIRVSGLLQQGVTDTSTYILLLLLLASHASIHPTAVLSASPCSEWVSACHAMPIEAVEQRDCAIYNTAGIHS